MKRLMVFLIVLVLSNSSLGSANDSSNYLIGSIAELIIYDSILPTGDLFVIYEYLAQKWNITI